MDAVLSVLERRPLVRLSLCPCFRRCWSSTCDALADGSLDVKALRALFQAQVPLPALGERPLWAVDGTHWPRPAGGHQCGAYLGVPSVARQTPAGGGPGLGLRLAGASAGARG